MISRTNHVAILLLMAACSTDPEVNWNQLDNKILVICELSLGTRWEIQDGQRIYQEIVDIQKLRPLVALAFDPQGDQFYGIPGASVTVSGNDTTLQFTDLGTGRYYWESDTFFTVPGKPFRLDIRLDDGREIWSEIWTPDLTLLGGADTVWIDPDSISGWSTEPGTHYPIEITGLGYQHRIEYELPAGNYLDLLQGIGYEDAINDPALYYRLLQTSDGIAVQTATANPAAYRALFEDFPLVLRYSVRHIAARNYDFVIWDDHWPVEDLAGLSNMNGALGFFFAQRYSVVDTCVMALK